MFNESSLQLNPLFYYLYIFFLTRCTYFTFIVGVKEQEQEGSGLVRCYFSIIEISIVLNILVQVLVFFSVFC